NNPSLRLPLRRDKTPPRGRAGRGRPEVPVVTTARPRYSGGTSAARGRNPRPWPGLPLGAGPRGTFRRTHPAGRYPPTVLCRPRAGPRWRNPMRPRCPPWIPLLALLALPAPALAQGKAEPPAVVVRVRSLESLFESGKILLGAAGKGEMFKQIEDLVKS